MMMILQVTALRDPGYPCVAHRPPPPPPPPRRQRRYRLARLRQPQPQQRHRPVRPPPPHLALRVLVQALDLVLVRAITSP